MSLQPPASQQYWADGRAAPFWTLPHEMQSWPISQAKRGNGLYCVWLATEPKDRLVLGHRDFVGSEPFLVRQQEPEP